VLRKYCQQWGFSAASKRKEELVALAYGKEEERSEERQQYNELLPLNDGSIIPNPFGFYVDRWMSQVDGAPMHDY